MLSKDFKEFLQLLNKNKVAYLVVGGYAVAFHGYPRYTRDIDIWIKNDINNAINLLKVLEDFGFKSGGLSNKDFLKSDNIIQLGFPPNRIDLITGLKGVNFDKSYTHKEEIEIDGIKIFFINREDLKKSKSNTGRKQDLADIENLE